jgi:hypothetical protein
VQLESIAAALRRSNRHMYATLLRDLGGAGTNVPVESARPYGTVAPRSSDSLNAI